jgi:cytochrome P450
MTQDVHVDFAHPGFQSDPHPTYRQLRRAGPVRLVKLPSGVSAWLVTRYDDARRALSDPRLSKAVPVGGPAEVSMPSEIRAAIMHHMLNADPPDHTRLRRLVSTAFTSRRIEALRPRIGQITEELLDRMNGRDRLDLIDAFAFPLPIQVICELLGVPVADRDSFRAWSGIIVAGSQSGGRLPGAVAAMVAYIRGLIADRRGRDGDDLLAALISATDDGDRLSRDELTSMVFLLLVAGHETTVNLIGNGAFLLLSEPERWERLRAEPSLLPSAIEEFLRFDGPVETATFRVATEEVEIGGQTIPAGAPVLVVLLSANRDDERFPDAGKVVLDRAHNPHLAFGHGIHYCLGAPLARMEAHIAFEKLLGRYPDLRLAVDPAELRWRPGVLLRGLQELPVTPGALPVH